MPTTYAIPNGATQFAATLWSGTSATQNIVNGASTSGISFQPDLVWVKGRNNTTNHQLVDSVRGTSLYLSSDQTTGNATNVTALTSFNSNGFTLGNNSNTSQRVNYSGDTYVGWQWKAGGSIATNTAGSITSQVNANQTAGFSIVTYTGNGTNPGATIGHGLNGTPKFIIAKSFSTGEFPCYHASLPISNTIYLNATYPSTTFLNRYSAVSPTTFTTGSSGSELNSSGINYVAYCWAEIEGYSKFGSYTGATGLPFVYLGFRPRWLMFKRTDAASTIGWVIWDTTRGSSSGGNVVGYQLYPNTPTSESSSSTSIDILSNGFKFRDTYQDWNANNATYIYAAFAENPFKYANAR